MVIIILLPAFSLIYLSIFGLLIPAKSPAKLGYSVTMLLSMFVYKAAVQELVAPWQTYADTPKLVLLFTGMTLSKFFFERFFTYLLGTHCLTLILTQIFNTDFCELRSKMLPYQNV